MNFTAVILAPKSIIDLKQTLQSLLSSNLNKNFSIIVMVNGPDATIETYLKQFMKERSQLNLVFDVGPAPVNQSELKNRATPLVKTPYLVFLKSGVELPEHYLNRANQIIQAHQPEAFGGTDITHPEAKLFEKVVGAVFTSKMAKGPQSIKHGIAHNMKTTTTEAKEFELHPDHLWFKTEVFQKYKMSFDNRLDVGAHKILLAQLVENKRKIYFIQDLFVYNHRFSGFVEVIKYCYQSARFQIYSYRIFPKYINPMYLMPTVLLLYCLSLPLMQESAWFNLIYVYLILVFFYSILICLRSQKMIYLPTAFMLHLFMHMTYGFGGLISLFKRPKFLKF
ncbi:MAG: hypothetical protein JNM93_09405 [Bacteriovoracaceae bacterium]|nr:hypothetical protein [Bacteriovoracaceae bacterium]